MATSLNAADHRANRLLAAMSPQDFAQLEPHLEIVDLRRGQVLYEIGETLRHAYFPHHTIVSLVTLMQDGGCAEMAVFGREGLLGLVTAMVIRRSFGRYVVQLTGSPPGSRLIGSTRPLPRVRRSGACSCTIPRP